MMITVLTVQETAASLGNRRVMDRSPFLGRMPTLFGPKRVAGAPEQVMVCLEAGGLLVPRNGTVKSVVCLVRSARTARPVTCEA